VIDPKRHLPPTFKPRMRAGLLFVFLSGCAAPDAADPPAALGWIEDQPFPITQSYVYAEDNDNLDWAILLHSPRTWPADFNSDLRRAWVEIGGVRQRLNAVGGGAEGTDFYFRTGRGRAQSLARTLGVPAGARSDPGLLLQASAMPAPRPLHPGGPLPLQFVLTNGGPASFAFTRRARGVAERDQDFAVEISRDGQALPGIPAEVDLGGLRPRVLLAPGESATFELDLAAWVSIPQPGAYQARIRYRLRAEPAESERLPYYSQAHRLWDAEAVAECVLTIE